MLLLSDSGRADDHFGGEQPLNSNRYGTRKGREGGGVPRSAEERGRAGPPRVRLVWLANQAGIAIGSCLRRCWSAPFDCHDIVELLSAPSLVLSMCQLEATRCSSRLTRRCIAQVFGVARIFASFNDTFVHVTDMTGRETLVRVTGGMKVKADRDESSPYAAMLAAQDVAVRLKELGASPTKLRGASTKVSSVGSVACESSQWYGARYHRRARQDQGHWRRQDQDPRPGRAGCASCPGPFWPQDWSYRGRHSGSDRLHPQEGWSSWSPTLGARALGAGHVFSYHWSSAPCHWPAVLFASVALERRTLRSALIRLLDQS